MTIISYSPPPSPKGISHQTSQNNGAAAVPIPEGKSEYFQAKPAQDNQGDNPESSKGVQQFRPTNVNILISNSSSLNNINLLSNEKSTVATPSLFQKFVNFTPVKVLGVAIAQPFLAVKNILIYGLLKGFLELTGECTRTDSNMLGLEYEPRNIFVSIVNLPLNLLSSISSLVQKTISEILNIPLQITNTLLSSVVKESNSMDKETLLETFIARPLNAIKFVIKGVSESLTSLVQDSVKSTIRAISLLAMILTFQCPLENLLGSLAHIIFAFPLKIVSNVINTVVKILIIPCLISSFTLLLRRLCTRYAVYVHCAPRAA